MFTLNSCTLTVDFSSIRFYIYGKMKMFPPDGFRIVSPFVNASFHREEATKVSITSDAKDNIPVRIRMNIQCNITVRGFTARIIAPTW